MSLCPICQHQERKFSNARILGKYEVLYYFCDSCGFLHTEKPYWLKEAYADAIVAADTGIVRRNLDASGKTSALFCWMFGRDRRYLDVAGGYGLFARLMRDMGFDYHWSDAYAQNAFARGFELDQSAREDFDAVTAFEALEHVEDPLAFIESIRTRTRFKAFLCSTELYSGTEPPADWWYYSRETGQHISFFHRRTLETIASRLNLQFYSNASFHMLSTQPVNALIFRALTSRLSAKLSPLIFVTLGNSKIASDHELLRKRSHCKPD